MGKDRSDVEEGYPGDVVGLFDPGIFRIGDTLTEEGSFNYPGIPSFSPERFMRVEVARVMKRKALEKGLDQLAQEGAVQLFSQPGAGSAGLILGAMGALQFDVMIHRMAGEYGVKLELSPLPFELARWVQGDFDPAIFRFSERIAVVEDREGRPVLLARSGFDLDRAVERNPELELSEVADPHLFESASNS
jgi:peptide chain release factor 3